MSLINKDMKMLKDCLDCQDMRGRELADDTSFYKRKDMKARISPIQSYSYRTAGEICQAIREVYENGNEDVNARFMKTVEVSLLKCKETRSDKSLISTFVYEF